MTRPGEFWGWEREYKNSYKAGRMQREEYEKGGDREEGGMSEPGRATAGHGQCKPRRAPGADAGTVG